MLSKAFTTTTREEFIDIAKDVADKVLTALKKSPTRPYVVSITGDIDAGKSVYWDVFATHLLDKGAIFIPSKSESTEKYGRFHETWVGENSTLKKTLTLCFCNTRGAGPTNPKEPYISLVRGDYQKLGDVVVLTNAPPGFIPEEFPRIDVNVFSMDDHPDEGWNRSVQILSNHPK